MLYLFSQTGTLQGTIIDAMTNEPIPFANVVLTKNGNQSAGTTTDFDGKYILLNQLTLVLTTTKTTFVGYQTKEITGLPFLLTKLDSLILNYKKEYS